MIWLKRIAPFVLIAVLWFSYSWYTEQQRSEIRSENNKYALLTAKTWIASVKYRENPEKFLAYRDSLLTAENASVELVKEYVERYRTQSEYIENFSNEVKECVDSLMVIEDSLKAVADSLTKLPDSLKK